MPLNAVLVRQRLVQPCVADYNVRASESKVSYLLPSAYWHVRGYLLLTAETNLFKFWLRQTFDFGV